MSQDSPRRSRSKRAAINIVADRTEAAAAAKADAATPAAAVKASKLAAVPEKPAPDVSSAADRAEPDDDPYMEPEYEDTPAGRRRKARHARESKKSSDDLFEHIAASGKLSDDEIADYRESGIMPAYTSMSPCGTPQYHWKPDQAEVEKARADRAAAKAKLGADAVAPSDDQRKAALRLAVVTDNVVTLEPKADGEQPVGDADPLANLNEGVDDVDIKDHGVGAQVIYGSFVDHRSCQDNAGGVLDPVRHAERYGWHREVVGLFD